MAHQLSLLKHNNIILGFYSGISKRCRVFSLVNPPNDRIIDTPIKEMSIHKGYVTDCMFFGSDQQVLGGGRRGRERERERV